MLVQSVAQEHFMLLWNDNLEEYNASRPAHSNTCVRYTKSFHALVKR